MTTDEERQAFEEMQKEAHRASKEHHARQPKKAPFEKIHTPEERGETVDSRKES
jgi:hypothetical protein